MIRVTFEGVEEWKAMCKDIPERLHAGIFQRAFRKGFKPLVSAIKSKTPIAARNSSGSRLQSRNHTRGNLRRSIGVIAGKKKRFPTAWAGVRFTPAYDPWYAHYVAGKVNVPNKRKNPNPFVKDAYNQVKDSIISAVEAELQAEVQKVLDRLAK